jgi:glycosyltransferase involved in cell wall biosynthesis
VAEAVFAIPGNIETATGGYAYDRRLLELLPTYGVPVRLLELPASFPAPSPADLAATERRLAASPRDAVLLIDGLAYGALPPDLIRRLERKVVALVHHPLSAETGLSEERRRALHESERAALALARHVVTTSPAMARTLASDYAVPPRKIRVAEPGTDPAARATGTGTPMQLLAVGAVSERKGYGVLVEALILLRALDWRLRIAGALDREPAAVASLKAAIHAASLDDRIALAGTVVPATLDRFYESADIFVMPSLFEGYGMVLAEAMSRGLPIVCTTGGASGETAPDGAALKVPPGDAPALSEAIASLLHSRKLRTRMADASWEAGRKLPTWNETARRVAAALLDLEA